MMTTSTVYVQEGLPAIEKRLKVLHLETQMYEPSGQILWVHQRPPKVGRN